MNTQYDIRQVLLDWWERNGRVFPWRSERDPYRIFIAETLLHRTKAENVLPVYEDLIRMFPSFSAIAHGNESVIRNIIYPLGLRWRTERLLEACRLIYYDQNCKISMEKDRLMQLPGVGDYIASAIRVFCFGKRDPLIDANTVRVISRFRGMSFSDVTRRNLKVKTWYLELLGNSDPIDFAYSLIDLSALICLPNIPKCNRCPLLIGCQTGIRKME